MFAFKKIFILFVVLILLVPFAVSAKERGLVPCDGACPRTPDGQLLDAECVPCTFCHLLEFIIKLARFALVDVFFPLAGLMILWGGIMMVLGEKSYGKGKEILKNTVFGLVISLAAFIIVNTIIIGLASQTTDAFNPQEWWTINCK